MPMRLARYSALLPGAAMAVLIAGGIVATPPAAYVAAVQGGPIDDVRRLIEGHYTEAFEDLYANELFGRDLSVDFWGALDFAVFGEGTSKVVVGRNGWLFTAEEFERPPGHDRNLERNLQSIRNAKARLDRLGIPLIVAVVPPKTAIYPQMLAKEPPPHRLAARTRFLDGLDAAGVEHVYLEAALRPASSGDSQTFMSRDTHWSPAGAGKAGKAVADAARATFPAADLPEKAFVRQAGDAATHAGDLMKFTPVGSFASLLGLDPEPIQPFTAEVSLGPDAVADAAASLFGAAEIPVALIGTSYSAQETWGFAEALRIELQADVLNLSEEGGGPVAPMKTFLQGLSDMDAPPRLVIWEWPARFVDTDYAEHAIDAP